MHLSETYFLPLFLKPRALVHALFLFPTTGFQPRHKIPRFESLHPLSSSNDYESIIVILSVMCIVPKYYFVFCMIVILLIPKHLVLVSFKTLEESLHLCLASLLEASEIPP